MKSDGKEIIMEVISIFNSPNILFLPNKFDGSSWPAVQYYVR
jgi:hypothetical protein